jgi:regulator of protease activity HflC (stomatin/prohibitin superfamily)
MKKLVFLMMLAIASLSFSSCERVEPNYEGVLMENYGKNGKADFSIQSGKVWTVAAGTELYQVPMFEQKGDCPSLEVFAKDGGKYTVDPSYSYSPIRGKGIDIIFAYKHLYGEPQKFFDNVEGAILNTRVLNAYREEARKFTTDSLMNNVAKYEQGVQDRLVKDFFNKYFELSEITSNLTPPKSMSDAIEARNIQIQEALRIENTKKTRQNQIEIDIMEAEAKVKVAKLDAEARDIMNKTLTDNNLQKQWIEKWDGSLPSVVTGNSTLLNIPTGK